MDNPQPASIRMEMYEANALRTHVDFAKDSESECILDCDGREMARIFEWRRQLYAVGYGTKLARINRKLLTTQILLRTGDLLEIPDGAYTLRIIGDETPSLPEEKRGAGKGWIAVGVTLALLGGGMFWRLQKPDGETVESPPPSPKPEVRFAETQSVGILSKPMEVPPEVQALAVPARPKVSPTELFRHEEVAAEPMVTTSIPHATPVSLPGMDGLMELVVHDLKIPPGCVAVSPGGRLMAVGIGDGSARVMDSISGQVIRTLEGHEDSVSCVAFTTNGKQLLTGSYDGTLRLWDVETGREIHRLKGHTGPVRCLAISPDGTMALSGAVEGAVLLWDLKNGVEKHWFFGHMRMVNAVTFAPDGKRAASGSMDGSVRLWNLESGKELAKFSENLTGINALDFSPDGKTLLSGADGFRPAQPKVENLETQTLRQWNLAREKEIPVAAEMREWITALRFSQDGRYVLVATGGDPDVREGGPSHARPPFLRLYRFQGWEEIATVRHHEKLITDVAFFPDNERIVSTSLDGTLRIWTILWMKDRGR